MASKVEFPIRAKILLLLGGLVLVATASYLALAVKLFREDKVSLIYELNKSTVKTLSSETEAYLMKIADKMKLLTQGHRDPEWTKAVIEAEPDIVAYTLYRPTSDTSQWEVISTIRNIDYLKQYGLDVSAIDRLRVQAPIPFGKVLAKKSWASNSTLSGTAEGGGTAPLLTMALPISMQDGELVIEAVAVVDLRSDRIIKLLSDRGIATAYLVDDLGRIVAHPDTALVTSHALVADVPIVREANASAVALQIKQFEWAGKRWLGAYSAVGFGGLHVVSQVEEDQAFRASRKLVEKSVLFSLAVMTAALLLSGWLARSLTGPLEKLLAATEKLSRWEFGESVHVKSRDEIARLARAFNAMASDLQNQRAQLESSRTELELRVKDRTSVLEQQKAQILEAQEALLRTTRLASLGELAGAAAHEVLNPLNNINIRLERIRSQVQTVENSDVALLDGILTAWQSAFSSGGWEGLEKDFKSTVSNGAAGDRSLLEEDLANLTAIAADTFKRNGERLEDMEFLVREVSRITRIVNSMRSLSRVGGERRALDVHAPLDDTAVAVEDQLAKNRIALIKDYGAEARELYSVVADKDELVQVFSNLIRNASQAVTAAQRRVGEIRISTSLSRANPDSEGRVEVRISDNGVGISKKHEALIFEPSFTTKSLQEGTGLGLSISRRLVRAFGGDIEVEKTLEGEGTTFLIWFPEAGEPEEPEAPENVSGLQT